MKKTDLVTELNSLKKDKAAWKKVDANRLKSLKDSTMNLWIGWRSNNFNMNKANETGKKLEQNANAIADATAKNSVKFWKKISDKTIERDAPKLDRVEKREDDVKEVIDDYKDISDNQRRDELSDITDRQKGIASRQANIAAAKAGSQWVQLSEWEKISIKDDIIAKYGQNIMTAEQYELENNRTIDADLKNIGIQEFEIQSNIDQFKDVIRDNAFAPILNALDEAKKWNQKAIDDVASFYQEIVRNKGIEESERGLQRERLQDTEQEYQGMDLAQKAAYTRAKMVSIPWFEKLWLSVEKIIQKNPNASYSFIYGELAREASDSSEFDAKTNALFQKNDEDLSDNEREFKQKILEQGNAAKDRGNPNFNKDGSEVFPNDTTEWIRDAQWDPRKSDTIEKDRLPAQRDQAAKDEWFKDDKAKKTANTLWKKFTDQYWELKNTDKDRYDSLRKRVLTEIKARYTSE